jgi:gamma-butyrobetaine dioxygenase
MRPFRTTVDVTSRVPSPDEHEQQINDYADLLATLTAQVRHETTLAAGEVLILDNYRCLHGARDHEGTRTTHVLRCKPDEAW